MDRQVLFFLLIVSLIAVVLRTSGQEVHRQQQTSLRYAANKARTTQRLFLTAHAGTCFVSANVCDISQRRRGGLEPFEDSQELGNGA